MWTLLQNHFTPLMEASREGHATVVEMLLEHDAQVDLQDDVCCLFCNCCRSVEA